MADNKIFISEKELKDMLSALMEQRTVYAPVSNGKKLDYLQVKDIDSVVFSDELPYKSPKELFFPRCEKIILFKDGDVAEVLSEEKNVLFGAKPCDLEALDILRKIFTEGKFKDPYFETRCENTLMIGVSCIDKKPGCFCEERGTDLGYSDKCDLFLSADKGSGFEVLYVSERGRGAFSSFIEGLAEFENAPHEFNPETTLTIDATEEELFDNVDFGKIVQTCQGCGMCTFICPTCHCFMFKDVNEGDQSSRYRCWDSCMFPKFTLHASGHNPREERYERYRQRIAHKYCYLKKNFDVVSCTGCGRCVRSCPAGMNIKNIVHGVVEELNER